MSSPRLVRNQVTGRILPCCWDDCTSNGDQRIRIKQRTELGFTTYIFCRDLHKVLWANAHRGMPPGGGDGVRFEAGDGSGGAEHRSPAGLILPG